MGGTKGPGGISGVAGKLGSPGSAGRDGKAGEPGRNGAPGKSGAPGEMGPAGRKGHAGSIGIPGYPRPSGAAGERGDAGRPGLPGKDGSLGSVGAQGPAGPAGAVGFGGAAGAPGGRGSRGPTGRAGPAGAPGEAGAPGGVGSKGWRGLQGPAGQEGEQGPPGEQGLGGPKGPVGPVGLQGPPGPPGPTTNPFSSEYFATMLPFVRKEFTKQERTSSSDEGFPMGYFQLKYYRSVQDNSNTKAALTMFNLLDVLDIKAESERKPDGSKFFPAKSCSDIQMCFPASKNGKYWLDPNGGAKTDAFKVYCDFTKSPVETCVKPTTSFQGEWNKKVNKEFNWIGQDLEAESGQVMYEPRPTQWNSLRLDHTHARQNVTYNCKNSLAYRTVEGGKHTFLKFLASDSQEVTAFGKRDKMNVLKDECHMKDPVWRKAVFEIDTSVMDKLPLRDIAVSGAEGNDEFYSVEMGSVCFY